jgi:hypothetical protein
MGDPPQARAPTYPIAHKPKTRQSRRREIRREKPPRKHGAVRDGRGGRLTRVRVLRGRSAADNVALDNILVICYYQSISNTAEAMKGNETMSNKFQRVTMRSKKTTGEMSAEAWKRKMGSWQYELRSCDYVLGGGNGELTELQVQIWQKSRAKAVAAIAKLEAVNPFASLD